MIEGEFLERERAGIRDLAAGSPTDADGFLTWFEGLRKPAPARTTPSFPG